MNKQTLDWIADMSPAWVLMAVGITYVLSFVLRFIGIEIVNI